MLGEEKRIELQGLLMKRGLTQAEVARALDIAEETLSRVLRGRQHPPHGWEPVTFELEFRRGMDRAAEERTKRLRSA